MVSHDMSLLNMLRKNVNERQARRWLTGLCRGVAEGELVEDVALQGLWFPYVLQSRCSSVRFTVAAVWMRCREGGCPPRRGEAAARFTKQFQTSRFAPQSRMAQCG